MLSARLWRKTIGSWRTTPTWLRRSTALCRRIGTPSSRISPQVGVRKPEGAVHRLSLAHPGGAHEPPFLAGGDGGGTAPDAGGAGLVAKPAATNPAPPAPGAAGDRALGLDDTRFLVGDLPQP